MNTNRKHLKKSTNHFKNNTNLCLAAQPVSSNGYLLLSNCSDSADQYFIVDRTFQISKQLLYATAPKNKISQSNVSLSDDPDITQPFSRLFEAVP
jgi:hypothetical protein